MFVLRNTFRSHNIVKTAGKLSLPEYTSTTTTTAAAARRPALFTLSNPHHHHHHHHHHSTLPNPPTMSAAAAPLTAWNRLIRYVSAKDGSIKYGEPIVPSDDSNPDIDALAQKGGLQVKVLAGDNPLSAKPTGEEDEVKQLLGPLTPRDVPIVRCVGLNYRTHSKWRRHPSIP